MKVQDLPPTLTVERAGQLLGISRYAAYRAASSGEIPVLRLGRRLVVPTARLLAMLGIELYAKSTNASGPGQSG